MTTTGIKYSMFLRLFSREVLLWSSSDNRSSKIFSLPSLIKVLFRIMSLRLMSKFTKTHGHRDSNKLRSTFNANSKNQWIVTTCCWTKSQPRSGTNHQTINVAWSCLSAQDSPHDSSSHLMRAGFNCLTLLRTPVWETLSSRWIYRSRRLLEARMSLKQKDHQQTKLNLRRRMTRWRA